MQQLSIKRGDTLYAECQLVDEFGAGKTIAGMVVSATLADRGGNVAHTFAVTVLNEPDGRFKLSSLATGNLPAALYVVQISYTLTTANNTVASAEHAELLIAERLTDATRAAMLNSAIGNTRLLLTTPNAPAPTVWSETWAD